MNHRSIWSMLEESNEVLGDSYAYPAMAKAAEELSLSPDYFTWVAAVALFGAEPFTVAQFMHMFPYGLAQVNEARFQAAVGQGFLAVKGGGFHAAASGLNAVRHIIGAMGRSIAFLHPMPAQPLRALVDLLYQATATTATPPHGAHAAWKGTRGKCSMSSRRAMRQPSMNCTTNSVGAA